MEDINCIRKQRSLEIISSHLDVIVKQARTRPRSNPKKNAESVLCGLLNLFNGWKLIPYEQDDFIISPVDFFDKKKRIALKVVYDANTEDIIRTLRIFSNYRLYSRFHSLFILIISDQIFPFGSPELPQRHWFSPDANILDVFRIKSRVQNETNLEMLEKVSEYLDAQVRYFITSSKHPTILLPPPPRPSESFLPGSRSHEMEQLIHLMDQKNPIFLWGPAGIGKTELAIQLAKQYSTSRGAYFLHYRQPKGADDASMIETILQADFDGHTFEYTTDRKMEYQERLSLLREAYSDTMIIIDGFDCPRKTLADLTDDPSYRDLVDLCQDGLHLVFTTRSNATGKGLEIGPLSNDILLKLLRDSYPDDSTTDDHLLELLHAVECNTLIANLMTQILRSGNGEITPWMLMETLLKGNSSLYEFPQVVSDQNRSFKRDTFINHLYRLLDTSSIGEDAIHVLMCATFLPEGGINDHLFFNSLPSQYQYILPYLFDGQWLRLSKKVVSIPPLVRHVCLNKPAHRYEGSNFFLDNLWGSFDLHHCDKSMIEEIAICFSTAADRCIEAEGINAMRAGRFWDFAGNEIQALRYYIQSLLMKEKCLPVDHPDLVIAYIDAAKYLIPQHRYQKSLEYNLRALEILKATLPSDHLDLASAHLSVAISLGCSFYGRYQEALENILKVISIREIQLPKNHPDIAIAYYHLGHIFEELDDYPVSLSYHQKAQSLFKTAIPFDHANLKEVSACITKINKKIDAYQERLEELRKQISAPDEILLSDPIELAGIYGKAAECCLGLDDYESALEYYRIALEITKQIPRKDQHKIHYIPNIISKAHNKKSTHQKALEITHHS